MRVSLISAFATAALSTEGHGPSVSAHFWRPSADGFVYPEVAEETGIAHLADREEFGIAFAGGGGRGFALAHGAMRALRDAGILKKAKYISVSSGSVWFAVPLYFQSQDDVDKFFGRTLPLDQLTPEALVSEEIAGSAITRLPWPITPFPKRFQNGTNVLGVQENEKEEFLQYLRDSGVPTAELERLPGCFDDIIACLIDHVVATPQSSLHQIWTYLTGVMLMRPHELTTKGAVYCHSSQSWGLRERLGDKVKIYPSRDVELELPFLISQDAILSLHTGTDKEADPLLAFPHENTLMYAGVPTSYQGDITKKEAFSGLGDLLVEPFAASSVALGPVPEGPTGEVSVRRKPSRRNLGDLADWQAKTTDLFSMYQVKPSYSHIFEKIPKTAASVFDVVLPQQWMWSPLDVDRKGVPKSHALTVGDAGVYDDNGHIPLLRRGVKKMVIFDSWVHHNSEEEDMLYTKTAFGVPTGFMGDANPPGCPNRFCPRDFVTVFEPSEFPSLYARAKALFDAKKPCVVRDTFTTVENKHFGVKGGQKIEIVFVFQLPVDAYVAGLPAQTQENLQDFFPQVDSAAPRTHFDLAVIQQYASYVTEQAVLPEIQSMLEGEVLV